MRRNKYRSPAVRRRHFEQLETRLAMAVYINEIHNTPLFGSISNDQYVEIRSDDAAAIPQDTYLVVIDSSVFFYSVGEVQAIFNLSNQSVGSNGFLALTQSGNRYVTDPDARVLTGTNGFLGMPGGIFSSFRGNNYMEDNSNTYLLIQSSVPPVIGDDIDSNDDGTPDASTVWKNWNILDGVTMAHWLDDIRPIYGYAPIMFREDGVGTSTTAQVIVDTEDLSYLARIGDSIGSDADDWVAGHTSEDVSGGVADFRLEHGIFGTPRPYFFSGRNLDHLGGPNFVGTVSGIAFDDGNFDGIQQPSELPLAGVKIIADQDGSGNSDNTIYSLVPDQYASREELTNEGPLVSLTVTRDDNTPIGFVVRAANRNFNSTDKIFASEGIPWFDDTGRLRADFYRPAQAVGISFRGTSVFTPTYGRIDAYDASGTLISTVRTGPLMSNQTQDLFLDAGTASIAYAVLYCNNNYLSSNPFGELDNLRYIIPEATVTTGADGRYTLNLLEEGAYRVYATAPAGKIQSTPLLPPYYDHTVLAASSLADADFGFYSNQTPEFLPQAFTLTENMPNGTIVGSLLANDTDPGQIVSFRIESGDTEGIFGILGNDIVLLRSDLINFETSNQRVLTIRASDNFGVPASQVADVTIRITDANDAPKVVPANVQLNENSAAGFLVSTITASDEDAGAPQSFVYSIVAGNVGNALSIDPTTGVVRVVGTLDFETTPTLSVTIAAQETTPNPKTGTAILTLRLRDVNEAPAFVTSSFVVNENSAVGSNVGTLFAIDPDFQQSVQYRIDAGTAASLLEFEPGTNRVRVAPGARFDFETTSAYTLIVTATDSATPALSSTKTIPIIVANLNDPPTLLPQTLTVAEGSTDVGNVTGSDQDANQSIRFAIVGGTDVASFTIDPVTGKLTTKPGVVLDFETRPNLTVEIEATDDSVAKATTRAIVTVRLTDAQDAPVITTSTLEFAENLPLNAIAGKVVASDQDAGDSLTYTLLNLQDKFSIDAQGVLRVQGGFDFETQPSLLLDVSVTDGNKTVVKNISLQVKDANDAPTPTGSIPNQATLPLRPWALQLPSNLFIDVDQGDMIEFSLFTGTGFDIPVNLAFDPTTRTVSGTFTEAQRGNRSFMVVGEDRLGATARSFFNVEVQSNAWHNYDQPTNVDGQGATSPLDALRIVNYLNLGLPSDGPQRPGTPPAFLDVNKDGFVTALDALNVINFLNLNGPANAEAEAAESKPVLNNDLVGSDVLESTYELLATDRLRRRSR